MKFCDYYGFEYAQACADHLSVPLLKIESDYTTQSSGAAAHPAGGLCRGLHATTRKGATTMDGERLFCGHRQRLHQHRRGHPGPGQATSWPRSSCPPGPGPPAERSGPWSRRWPAGGPDPGRDLTATVTTGYGRGAIQTGDKSVTEITCHAKGAHFLDPARSAPSSTSAARTARSSAWTETGSVVQLCHERQVRRRHRALPGDDGPDAGDFPGGDERPSA